MESSATSLTNTTFNGANVSIAAIGAPGSAGGTLNIAGTTVNTPGTLTLKGDQVNLLQQSTETSVRNTSQGGDVAWVKTTDKGATDQKLNYNQFNVGQLAVDANHVQVGMNAKDSVEALGQQPGMTWVNQLQNDPKLSGKIDWVKVEEAHKSWDYRQQGLTPEAAAVVTVVVAYFTAGAASGIGGSVASGVGATGTTATVISGAVTAGVTALASQASVSLINNQGDIGRTLHDLGSSAGVKSLLTAIVTGGVLGGLNLNPTGLPTAGGGSQEFFTQLGQNLQAGAARAVIGTAINGGSFEQNLKDSLKNAILDTVAAQAANAIGDLTKKDGVLNDFTNKVAHAIAGCVVGAARADNAGGCGAGALGAAIGELAAEAYGRQPDTVQFAAMISGLAVAIAGGDASQINLGSQAGGNAAANNFLNHDQWDELAKRFAACKQQPGGCSTSDERALREEYQRKSAAQDKELAAVCADPGSSACRTMLETAQQGSARQQTLVSAGQLPEYYFALPGSDFNANVRLTQQRVDAYDVIAACAANPTQCDQQRLQGAARLLFTGVSVAAMTVLAAEVGIVGLGVTGEGLYTFCGSNPQRCMNLVNAVAEVTTGAANPTSPTLGGTRPGATTQARGFGQYGVTRYIDANGKAIEVGNVIPGGLGNAGLTIGSAEAIARAPLNLSQVSAEASFVTRVSVTNLARNDGKLGESLAQELMQNATGISFRPIQNNSGHGVDLLGIDETAKIIWAPEVKSSINGAFPDPNTLNLMQRTQSWINQAANGTITNQQISATDTAYAREVLDLIRDGYQLKPLVINVSIPRQNASGLASATVIPIN